MVAHELKTIKGIRKINDLAICKSDLMIAGLFSVNVAFLYGSINQLFYHSYAFILWFDSYHAWS
jgi:hypothetical protein